MQRHLPILIVLVLAAAQVFAGIKLPGSGVMLCYNATEEDECGNVNFPRQDGDYPQEPRYVELFENDKRFVMDLDTGLLWESVPNPEPLKYEEAENYCASLDHFGKVWHVPAADELESITDYGRFNPAIDTSYFSVPEPYAPGSFDPGLRFWSRTLKRDARFIINAVDGSIFFWPISSLEKAYVRCVAGYMPYRGQFVEEDNATLVDATYDLMWQKNEVRAFTWAEALQYCANLQLNGYKDWRLPSFREAFSITNLSLLSPAYYDVLPFQIDMWTSTTSPSDPSKALVLNGYAGLNEARDKSYAVAPKAFHCVRDHVAMERPEEPAIRAPEILLIQNENHVKLYWEPVSGAKGYILSYAPYPFTGEESIETIDLGNSTSIERNLPDGTAYYVAVQAYTEEDISHYSNIELIWLK